MADSSDSSLCWPSSVPNPRAGPGGGRAVTVVCGVCDRCNLPAVRSTAAVSSLCR